MKTQIAGYKGFQTYGQLPYPSLKPGKEVLAPNQIWEKTVRPTDKQSLLDNFHYSQSNYNKTQVVNVKPEDYKNHTHVTKGSKQGSYFQKMGTETLTKYDPNNEQSHVVTGVEHWKTNYQSGIVNPYLRTKAQRPDWTFPRPPYTVDKPIGKSEYQTQIGLEIGTKPVDKLNLDGTLKQGKLDEPLKMGTTQASNHIPGYTGFIPEAYTAGKALEHSKAEQTREVFSKIPIMDNYQAQIPGYAGFKPQAPINQKGQLREYCFSTQTGFQ